MFLMKAIDSSVEQGLNLFYGFRDNHTSRMCCHKPLRKRLMTVLTLLPLNISPESNPLPLSHNPALIVVLATAAD